MVYRSRNPGVRDMPLADQRGSLAEMSALGLNPFSDFGPGGDEYVNRARARVSRSAAAGNAQAQATAFRYGYAAPDVFGPKGQAAPVYKAPVTPNWRDIAAKSADRLAGQNFFDAVVPKGFGEVRAPSPVRKERLVADFIVSPKGEAQQNTQQKSKRTSPGSTKLRALAVGGECVDRPEGDTHGPGRWRGQWFPWCKE